MLQKLKEFFCIHWWFSRLMLSGGPKTHHVIVNCIKCDKTKTEFKGTRSEYHSKYHSDL